MRRRSTGEVEEGRRMRDKQFPPHRHAAGFFSQKKTLTEHETETLGSDAVVVALFWAGFQKPSEAEMKMKIGEEVGETPSSQSDPPPTPRKKTDRRSERKFGDGILKLSEFCQS